MRRPRPNPEYRLSLDPGSAWKVLAVVNESIRHAEMKGALILGAAGAVGGLLFNLPGSRTHHGVMDDLVVLICGLSTLAAATFAALCLTPRLRSRDEPDSVIYFHHIARRYRAASQTADYGAMLGTICADSDRLIADIAAQIWANSCVARQKFLMARLGLIAVLMAFLTLTAILITAV